MPGLNNDSDIVPASRDRKIKNVLIRVRYRGDFAGKVFTYTIPDTDQNILDFSIARGGDYIGVIVEPGHVLDSNGLPSTVAAPAAYRTLFSGLLDLPRNVASFTFTNSRPTRLTTLFDFQLIVSNQLENLDLALVSVTSDT